MLLLNASYFGKYASLPIGWLFMACLVIIEIVLMSKLLERKFFNFHIAFATIVSNVVSGIIGAYSSLAINGGRLLTVWFPWVSSSEVDVENEDELIGFILYFAAAFVVTSVIELIINSLFLKKRYEFRPVMSATIISNVVSFMVGCLLLYNYSFFFYD